MFVDGASSSKGDRSKEDKPAGSNVYAIINYYVAYRTSSPQDYWQIICKYKIFCYKE